MTIIKVFSNNFPIAVQMQQPWGATARAQID
jgi:hypothetical protein